MSCARFTLPKPLRKVSNKASEIIKMLKCSQQYALYAICMVLLLAGLVIGLACAELGARIYIRLRHPQITSHTEFRASRPPPYKDAYFFSDEFIKESVLQPGNWITPPGTRLVIPGDFQGKYFNVVKGQRQTIGQPSSWTRRILLFGG